MNRLHAFEWEDQPWLPRVFRDCITDHLRFALEAEEAMEMHRAVAACLKAAMERLGTREIVDLCSGGWRTVTRGTALFSVRNGIPN